MNHLSLELATYNIMFKWISSAHYKSVDFPSRPLEVPEHKAPAISTSLNAVTTSTVDGPATCTQTKTKALVEVPPSDASKVNGSPTLTGDHRDTILQMQWTDPFCKCISKQLINGKASHHESDTITNIDSLLYKHVMDASQKFLSLVIPKHGTLQYLPRHKIS